MKLWEILSVISVTNGFESFFIFDFQSIFQLKEERTPKPGETPSKNSQLSWIFSDKHSIISLQLIFLQDIHEISLFAFERAAREKEFCKCSVRREQNKKERFTYRNIFATNTLAQVQENAPHAIIHEIHFSFSRSQIIFYRVRVRVDVGESRESRRSNAFHAN